MVMNKPRILVVDDNENVRHVLRDLLELKGCEILEAGSAEDALKILSKTTADVAMVDIVLPGKSGLELLEDLQQRYPDCRIIMITGHGSAEVAVGAIGSGAFDYLEKPFPAVQEVWSTVHRAVVMSRGPSCPGPSPDPNITFEDEEPGEPSALPN
jgi:DNA-binding NtrC family response regulator